MRLWAARLLGQRLQSLPATEGVADVAALEGQLTRLAQLAVAQQQAALAARLPAVAAGEVPPLPLPFSVRRLVRSTLRAKPLTLLAQGVVPSPTQLGGLLKQTTPHKATRDALVAGDLQLASVLQETCRAFAHRRSLLLLNLEHQVDLQELPWFPPLAALARDLVSGAVDPAAGDVTAPKRGKADAPLPPPTDPLAPGAAELVAAVLTTWPHLPLPNELLSGLRALGMQRWPLVEQLAGDIFMGTFTDKYAAAAREAAALLRGTDYARHFRLPMDSLLADVATGEALAALCSERAGIWGRRASGGMRIIEEMMICTAGNLAVLVSRLGLKLDWPALALNCWRGLCRLAAGRPKGGHRIWQQRRSVAAAWRNLLFFVFF